MPGVSRKAICPRFPSLRMPTMRLRVICGFDETMETFCPRIRFRSVDFPAFGRPIRATTPKRGLRGLNGPLGLMIGLAMFFRLPRCGVTRLLGYGVTRLRGYEVAGLRGCRVTRL